MNLLTRSYKKELLDLDNIPFKHIRQNMQELNFINTYLGGHDITVAGLKKLVRGERQVNICEIGCGGGDNIAALLKWCRRNEINASFIGIDIKDECIQYASIKANGMEKVNWITSDYLKVVFDKKPDIIFSSLFCHHFTDEELITQLKWMHANSSIGFFINDLQRHPVAYYAIKLLTSLFSSSYLVKNDAPLSVARGFKKKEWELLCNKAGLSNVKISWKWAFRYLIIFKHA